MSSRTATPQALILHDACALRPLSLLSLLLQTAIAAGDKVEERKKQEERGAEVLLASMSTATKQKRAPAASESEKTSKSAKKFAASGGDAAGMGNLFASIAEASKERLAQSAKRLEIDLMNAQMQQQQQAMQQQQQAMFMQMMQQMMPGPMGIRMGMPPMAGAAPSSGWAPEPQQGSGWVILPQQARTPTAAASVPATPTAHGPEQLHSL